MRTLPGIALLYRGDGSNYTSAMSSKQCGLSCVVAVQPSLGCSKTQGTCESAFLRSAGGPILTSSCSPRKEKSIAPHSGPHSPHPPRHRLRGPSLFVPDSSRAFLSRPRTMHDEIRTGPPYGNALISAHNCATKARCLVFSLISCFFIAGSVGC